MALLNTLPKEIIIEILSQLPLHSLEGVAWTLCHPITEICISLLRPLFKYRRDKKHFIHIFGPIKHRDISFQDQDLKLPEIQDILGISPQAIIDPRAWDYPIVLDNLNLCGDFEWLKPLSKSITDDHTCIRDEPLITRRPDYEKVISTANRIGITLPSAFDEFMRDEEKQARFLTVEGDRYLISADDIVKVPRAWDGGIGGYTIPFLRNLDGQYLVSVYVEPGEDGSSCILLSSDGGWGEPPRQRDESECPEISEEDRKDTENLDLGILYPSTTFALLGIDFEAWLAGRYFQGKLDWICRKRAGSVPSSDIEYV